MRYLSKLLFILPLCLSGGGMKPIFRLVSEVDQEHRIVMDPLNLVTGRVVDKDTGEPVVCFKVKYYAVSTFGSSASRYVVFDRTYTSPDGRFSGR